MYLRAPPAPILTTRTKLRNQFRAEAPYTNTVLDFDSFGHPPLQTQVATDSEGSPFPLEGRIRILGVVFDDHFTLDAHIQGVLARAQVRQGTLARVGRCS